MMDPYADRGRYRALSKADDLTFFRVTEGETDLWIGASSVLRNEAKAAVRSARKLVADAIRQRPEFLSSLEPLMPLGDEPPLVRRMLDATGIAGTGPMAAVAGAIAREVGLALLPYSPNVTVENGGDVFLAGPKERIIAIVAGQSPLSGKLGIRVCPGTGLGVCTSSGTYGHSLSFGNSDAAVVLAPDAALSDAVATMLGNRCKCADDLGPAVEWATALPGIWGAAAILGDAFAAAGNLELTAL